MPSATPGAERAKRRTAPSLSARRREEPNGRCFAASCMNRLWSGRSTASSPRGGREQGGEVAGELALREDHPAAVAPRGLDRLDVLVIDEAEGPNVASGTVRPEQVEG